MTYHPNYAQITHGLDRLLRPTLTVTGPRHPRPLETARRIIQEAVAQRVPVSSMFQAYREHREGDWRRAQSIVAFAQYNEQQKQAQQLAAHMARVHLDIPGVSPLFDC